MKLTDALLKEMGFEQAGGPDSVFWFKLCEHKIAISKVTGVEPGTRYYLGSMPMETMQDLFNAIFLKGKKITQEKICDALGIKK